MIAHNWAMVKIVAAIVRHHVRLAWRCLTRKSEPPPESRRPMNELMEMMETCIAWRPLMNLSVTVLS